MATPSRNNRIGVLHSMRGIAALLVIYAHFFAVGLNDPLTPHAYIPAISGTAIDPAQASNAMRYLWPELQLGKIGINSGHLGVMLFFLISGFVINLSIHRTNQPTFLLRRVLRIYPTCFAAVVFTVLAALAYCSYKGVTYNFTIENALSSALLISGWVGQGAVIPVLWTLSVEVGFYVLLSAIAACTTGALTAKHINIASLVCIVIVLIGSMPLESFSEYPSLVAAIKWSAFVFAYIAYMLIGSAISIVMSSTESLSRRLATVAAPLAGYGIAVLIFNSQRQGLGTTFIGGLTILSIFIAALFLGKNLKPSRVSSFFGDISYPLYLVHIPLGWVVIYELTYRGVPLSLSVVLSLATIVLVAWTLHKFVELPSQRASKTLEITRKLRISTNQKEGV